MDSTVEGLHELTERLVRERQLLRDAGAGRRLLEANRQELVRVQWAFSAALVERYCGREAA
jgi:hypothetical protein